LRIWIFVSEILVCSTLSPSPVSVSNPNLSHGILPRVSSGWFYWRGPSSHESKYRLYRVGVRVFVLRVLRILHPPPPLPFGFGSIARSGHTLDLRSHHPCAWINVWKAFITSNHHICAWKWSLLLIYQSTTLFSRSWWKKMSRYTRASW
jgi:hypothetical protein